MNNLWILTEERPKVQVIKQILDVYCKEYQESLEIENELKIRPMIENGYFQFRYVLENVSVSNIEHIYLKTVSGNSSFLDFLVFQQIDEPVENANTNNLIMAFEETKTRDNESRNTGVYQRGTKFVYFSSYYQDVNLYMLYHNEHIFDDNKKPSATNIFGTNLLMTLGIEILNKNTTKWFHKFQSVEELIQAKSEMRNPSYKNIPLTIQKESDCIKISAGLAKPRDSGNIGHDPNIGALSLIGALFAKIRLKSENSNY